MTPARGGGALGTSRGGAPHTRALLVAVVLLCAGPVLQGTLLKQAAPGHVTVDLALAAAVGFAGTYGLGLGLLAALAAGFMMEAASGIGEFALAYVAAAVVAGLMADRGWGASLPAALACALVAVAVDVGVLLLALRFMAAVRSGPSVARIALWIGYETLLVLVARLLMGPPRASFVDDAADSR